MRRTVDQRDVVAEDDQERLDSTPSFHFVLTSANVTGSGAELTGGTGT